MPLKVVGAGLGRTGTASLQLALERLTGGRCYHMFELMKNTDAVPMWHRAVRGEPVDWATLMSGYAATVDWPAAAFWPELTEANPDAIVVLSLRSSPEVWWSSMERTIVALDQMPVPEDTPPELLALREMFSELVATRLTPDWPEPRAVIDAYERHAAAVREGVPAERLVEWQPGDGWAPLCEPLGLEVPAEPFPQENSWDDFQGNIEEHTGSAGPS
jgi:hypothetical protein